MIEFRRKEKQENTPSNKLIIYYSISDIFLGIILMALVAFFINDYLSHHLIFSWRGAPIQSFLTGPNVNSLIANPLNSNNQ